MTNVKVYALPPGGDTGAASPPQSQVWRFSIDSTERNFTSLSQKIKDVCGDNLNYEVGATVYWKDPEGDLISCSTDDELQEALRHVQEDTLKVFVKPPTTNQTPPQEQEKSGDEGTSQSPPRRGVWFGPHRGRGGRRGGGPRGDGCPPHVRQMIQRMMAEGHGPPQGDREGEMPSERADPEAPEQAGQAHGEEWMRRMWEEIRNTGGPQGEGSSGAEKASGSGPGDKDDDADLFPRGRFAWMKRFRQQRSRSPARGSGDEEELEARHHWGPWMGRRQNHGDKNTSDGAGHPFHPGMMRHFWRHKRNPNWECPRRYCPVREGESDHIKEVDNGSCGAAGEGGCRRRGRPRWVRKWMRAMHSPNQSDQEGATSGDEGPRCRPWMRRGGWNRWRRFEGEDADTDEQATSSRPGPHAHHHNHEGMMRHMWRHRMNPDWECPRKWCPTKMNKTTTDESSSDEARPWMRFHGGRKGCQAKRQHQYDSEEETTAGEDNTCRRRQFWRRMMAQHGRSDGEDDTEGECEEAPTRHGRPHFGHGMMAGRGCRGGPRGMWRRRFMRRMMQEKNRSRSPFQGRSSGEDDDCSAMYDHCSKGFGMKSAPWMRRGRQRGMFGGARGRCGEGAAHHPGMMRHFWRHKMNPDWECPRKCCPINTERASTATECSAGQCKAGGPPPFVRAMMANAHGCGPHHPGRLGMVMRMRHGGAGRGGWGGVTRGRFGGRGGRCPMRPGCGMFRGSRGRGCGKNMYM